MLKHTLAASLLACAALTPVAFAQDAKPQKEQSAQADSVNFIRDLQGEQFRSTNLVGKTVYNQQDEDIGDIGDLILDRSGRVAGVVIDVGGFLGIGVNEVAVPMNALRFVPDNDAMASGPGAAGSDAAATGRAATDANIEKQPGAAGSASGTSTSAALPNQNTKDQGNAQNNAAADAGQAKQAPQSSAATGSQSGAASGSQTNLATSDNAGRDANASANADTTRADEDTLANIKVVLNTSREDLQDAPKFGEAAN